MYEPIAYDSVFSDFNMTTCKNLEGGSKEYIDTIKVTIDSNCIPEVQLYVSILMISCQLYFLINLCFRTRIELSKKIFSRVGSISGYRLRNSSCLLGILGKKIYIIEIRIVIKDINIYSG